MYSQLSRVTGKVLTVAEQVSWEGAGFTVRLALGQMHLPGLSWAIRVPAAEQSGADHLNELIQDGFAWLVAIIEAVTMREIRPKVLNEIVQFGLLLGIIFTAKYQLSTLKKKMRETMN